MNKYLLDEISKRYYALSIIQKILTSFIYTIFLAICMLVSLLINKNVKLVEIGQISFFIFIISVTIQFVLVFGPVFLRLPYSIANEFTNEINFVNKKVDSAKYGMFISILLVHIGFCLLILYLLVFLK